MTKADITKTVIKIEYVSQASNGKKFVRQFPVNLQRWIQKTPEQQDNYVAQHTKGKIIEYNVL